MKHERRLATTLATKCSNWQLQKRRLQYQLLNSFGKQNLASPDDEYEHHEQRFLGLLQKLLDIRVSLEHYRATALPLYSAACASLGADVWCVVSVDAVGKGTDAEKFRHAMCAINETKEVKNHFFNADEVLAGAIRFLDIHINAMKSVASQLAHRKRVKLDFDCYARKLKRLQRSSRGSSARLERNELKLARARAALQDATAALYRVFAKYESERDAMLNGELEMVRQVMHSFYARNAAATDFAIAEDSDRAARDARTDRIYCAMVAADAAAAMQRNGRALSALSDVADGGDGSSSDEDDSSGPVGGSGSNDTGVTTASHEPGDAESHVAGTVSVAMLPVVAMTIEAQSSPAAAMVAPMPVATAMLTAAIATAAASSATEPSSPTAQRVLPMFDDLDKCCCVRTEPQVSEDDLSEKLKTIQLSRPNVQPRKTSRWRSSA